MKTIFRRGFLVPWILSIIAMMGLHYLWHGVLLTDIAELDTPWGLYLVFASIAYISIGFILTLAVDQCLLHGLIKLKSGFPFVSFLLGGIIGFLLYVLVFVLGVSYSENGAEHLLVDMLWQTAEQGVGGVAVALGIIYDIRRIQIEMEGG